MNRNNVLAVRPDKVIYRDGDTIIKVFNDTFSKEGILREAMNNAILETTDLPVPKVIEVCKAEGQWAIVEEFVEGKTLEQLMAENPEKEGEYLNLFVDLQMKIHATKAPSMLIRLRDKMRGKISQADLDATTRYDLHTRLEGMKRHTKICHGDFHPSNVIITPAGEAYIIDWAHVTQGNASADVARTYLLFQLEGKEDLAKKYMHLFCEKSDTAYQYVQKWLPIVAASQSVKGKAEEKELLLKWVDVVEYE